MSAATAHGTWCRGCGQHPATRGTTLQHTAARCCSVLPTAPVPRAVCRRCRHTPSCLSLSTPARPYLDDSGMPVLGCNVEAAGAVLVDAHDQRHAALLAQHLHPCGPARVMCVCVGGCVCVCTSVDERERESEREGGRERERNESEIVCACCSVLHFEATPHAGCGFLEDTPHAGCGFLAPSTVGFLHH